jgi:hypothetical protein
MGALVMFILVDIIAISAFIYFTKHDKNNLSRQD